MDVLNSEQYNGHVIQAECDSPSRNVHTHRYCGLPAPISMLMHGFWARRVMYECRLTTVGTGARYPTRSWPRAKQELGIMSMNNTMFPPDYFSKTDASFLVGEMSGIIAGCDTIASMHFLPDQFHLWNESFSYTYVSHSIKKFFSNL